MTENRARERRVTWAVRIGHALVRLLAFTWRIRLVNDAPWRALRKDGRAMVFAVWHGDLLAPVWSHRTEGMVAMISEHSDGEIIARIITRLGFGTARGSTTRGGTRALLEIIRALKRGSTVAFTPDGPRGPRHVVQPGLLAAAQRAGAPIVALGVASSRGWRMKSWDQFTIPKPFARICISYSEPTMVSGDAKELSSELPRIAQLMEDTNAAARRALDGG